MPKKVLAVAERANVKGVPDRLAFRAEWKARWEDPNRRIRYIMSLNSMIAGCATRIRMEGMLGVPADTKVVNLLCPDCVPGTWDVDMAKAAALDVMGYLRREESAYEGIILFGRRVAAAFRVPECEWGSRFTVADAPTTEAPWKLDDEGVVMVLPHPSGRSTVLNDRGLREELRAKVAAFVAS